MEVCSLNKQCGKMKEEHYYSYSRIVESAFYDSHGRKYGHQRRIQREKLEQFKIKVLGLENEFMKCGDFDSVYRLLDKNKPKGIGALTVYDVAFGISRNYGIYPEAVYLHADTKKGAVNSGLIERFSRKKQLSRDEIRLRLPWLADIEPYLIEDFLCIYKSDVTQENLLKFIQEKSEEKEDV